MTDYQLNKSNELLNKRNNIQGLIDFLSDHYGTNRFGLKIETRYKFLKIFPAGTFLKEFDFTIKEVIIDALIKRRDNLTKQIEAL